MVNDHLSDFVTSIRNGYLAGRREVVVPTTKLVAEVAGVLKGEGYILDFERADRSLVVKLKYSAKVPAVMGITRISKPGGRVYAGVKDLPAVWGGLGINILSTPKGVVSSKEAKKLKCGGEILAQVW